MAKQIVSVTQGLLQGRKIISKYGGEFYSFQGIPYAKPPVGNLRFKAPEPHPTWKGISKAVEEGPHCIQRDLFTKQIIGSEDCLSLNVYTPKLPSVDNVPKSLPVMVFIHGGGFMFGSGDSLMFGADYFVQEDVILVTMNYRLGPLGFLSMENEMIPGNCGLKDQLAALKWVQQNISAFGGDPDNVTLFGHSAGAACVHYLMLSSFSKNLFRRAICQSGSATSQWALNLNGRERATRLSQAVGIKDKTVEETCKLLLEVPAEIIAENGTKAASNEERRMGIFFPNAPVVENSSYSEEPLVTEDPENVVKKGEFNQIPFILGYNTHEGITATIGAVNNPKLFESVNNDFSRIIPVDLDIPQGTSLAQQVADSARKYYFGNKKVSLESVPEYINLFTDTIVAIGVHRAMSLHSRFTSSPLYYYDFGFEGEFAHKPIYGGADIPGVSHCDELGYLFSSPLLPQLEVEHSSERKMQSQMIRLWTNFAKYGKPTTDDDNFTWDATTKDNHCYLEIRQQLLMKKGLNNKRMEFWDPIYNKYCIYN